MVFRRSLVQISSQGAVTWRQTWVLYDTPNVELAPPSTYDNFQILCNSTVVLQFVTAKSRLETPNRRTTAHRCAAESLGDGKMTNELRGL
jgi:hypothetical protein